MPRRKYVRRRVHHRRRRVVHRRHRRHSGGAYGSFNKIPQYMLKPRFTNARRVNPLFSPNFRQNLYTQYGSGRRHRRHHRRRRVHHRRRRVHHRRRHRGGAQVVGFGRRRRHRRMPVWVANSIYHDSNTPHLRYAGRRHRRRHHRVRHHRRHRMGRGPLAYTAGKKPHYFHKIRGFKHRGVVAHGGRRHRRHRVGRHHIRHHYRRHTYGVGRRHRRRHHRRRRHRRGGSKFTDFLGKANTFLKDTKIASKLGHTISDVLPGPYGTIGHALSYVADKSGYGRTGKHHRIHHGRHGGSVKSRYYGHLANQAYYHNIHTGYGTKGYGLVHHRRRSGRGNPYPNTNSDEVKSRGVNF